MDASFKEIGKRLKHYMQKRGLTINKLAHATKLPAKKISKIIDGKSFSLNKVLIIMEVLSDISQVWLLTGGGDMLNKDSTEKRATKDSKKEDGKKSKKVSGDMADVLERMAKNQEKIVKQNKKIIDLLEEKGKA